MPNQPHATIPRSTAATFAPQVPKDARTKTGNGMPYFAPTCEFRSNGTVTIALPRITTKIEVAGSKPKTSPMFARLHDGMTTQQPTQNARNEYRPQLRNLAGVGARSLLYSWDLGSSPESSCLPSAVTTTDAAMVPSPNDHASTPGRWADHPLPEADFGGMLVLAASEGRFALPGAAAGAQWPRRRACGRPAREGAH